MKTKIFFSFAFLLFSITSALAVKHTIAFGGGLGNNYSPNTLTVEVGDTIVWAGTFSSHPLEATLRPGGAAPFGSGSGTTYTYPVTVAGDYAYHCTTHGSAGMTGTFTATSPSTGIRETVHTDVKIFPSVTSDVVIVELTRESANTIYAELLDAQGKLVSGQYAITAGTTTIDLSTSSKGVYFLVLKDETGMLAAKKIIRQ